MYVDGWTVEKSATVSFGDFERSLYNQGLWRSFHSFCIRLLSWSWNTSDEVFSFNGSTSGSIQQWPFCAPSVYNAEESNVTTTGWQRSSKQQIPHFLFYLLLYFKKFAIVLGVLPESLLWSYIIELCSALRSVHSAGLAVRALDPSKVLVTSRGRLRLCGGGIFDVLTYDSSSSNVSALIPHYQVGIRVFCFSFFSD